MKEALKLALEALEDFADVIKYDNEQDDIGSKACCGVLSYHPHSESCKAKQAITAIKAALAQPAQQEHDVDATIIQYHEATIKRLEKRIEELAQPVQEPWCMKMNGCKTKCEDCPDEPAQRPWVGLTEAQFLEAVRLAENGNYLVAFVRIQEWLKEQNT
jgi:hypothetical protein